MRIIKKNILIVMISCICFVSNSKAQETPVLPPQATQEVYIESPDVVGPSNETQPAQAQNPETEAVASKEINPSTLRSLLFTFWEQTAIQDARKSRGAVRPPTEDELARSLNPDEANKVKPPPEEREIRLAGIVYHAKNDWVVWINDERVTPKAVPPEVIDLNVYKDYIEIKWFDDWSNQIFPIRLRPNQRFNIDTRIFLPGD